MQYAEKVALVLQHYAEDREYKHIQKPGAAVARSTLSLDIKRILNDKRRDDDQKVKQYVNALHRYVNIRDKPPVEREVGSLSIILYADDILLLAPTVSSLQQLLHIRETELMWLDMSINVKKSSCLRVGPRSNSLCSKLTGVNCTSISTI